MGVLETILLILGLVVGIVLLLVLAYYMGKNKNIVPIVIGVVGIVFFGFSIFCIADLNYYYTAKGGIFGVVSNLFHANIVEEQEGLEFSLKNIELRQKESGNYSASTQINRTITFEEDVEYLIKVNGIPVTQSDVTGNYATGVYEYTFYNTDWSIKSEDTLFLMFAIYPNYSTLTVTTFGGSENVKLWNSYFQKNNFVITIEPTTFDTTAIVSQGDTSNLALLTYVVDDEVYSSKIYYKNQSVDLIIAPIKEGYMFSHWIDAEGKEVEKIDKLTSNTTLFAVYVQSLLDGQYIATTTYALEEMGFTMEDGYTIDLVISLDIENCLLKTFAYKATPTFDFEEMAGMSFDEYCTANGEPEFCVSGIQTDNVLTFTITGAFRTGEQVKITYDYSTNTWLATNNFVVAAETSFEKVL